MTFRDFIPEGEDVGALGKGGFRDFVPDEEMEADKALKEEFDGPSTRWTLDRLQSHAKSLGVNVSENADKKVVLSAINKAGEPKVEPKPEPKKKPKKLSKKGK